MTDQHDLERALRTFEHQASPRVREVALGAAPQRRQPGRILWAWRIPLPIAAAGVALVATFAFMAGQKAGDDQTRRPPGSSGPTLITVEGTATAWAVAASDVLAERTPPVGRPRAGAR